MRANIQYELRRNRAAAELAAARANGSAVGLRKVTSNLFRTRRPIRKRRLDVRMFRNVLDIDCRRETADVEGMATYDTIVRQTLPEQLLPAVTPELKTITAGGAVGGIGIESSSFRHGLVHDTVEDMEVLTGDGRVVFCSRNENSDLFCALPNSYGTLGYILKLRLKLIPARAFVRVGHSPYASASRFFAALESAAADATIGFLDGTVFAPGEMYITTARFAETAPRTSDYTYLRMYFQSIRERREDYLLTRDYIWRWDTDWFWCSRQFGMHHTALRLLASKWLLNSRTYQKVMRLSNRLMPPSNDTESVIQDVGIPIDQAEEFLRFLLSEIQISPVWVCPFRTFSPCPLYRMDLGRLYVNFGFWDVIPSGPEPGYFNKKVESATAKFGGRKALYSSSWYSPDDFWRLHGREEYYALKQRYDPDGILGDLYGKCVDRR